LSCNSERHVGPIRKERHQFERAEKRQQSATCESKLEVFSEKPESNLSEQPPETASREKYWPLNLQKFCGSPFNGSRAFAAKGCSFRQKEQMQLLGAEADGCKGEAFQ
jgi:hypothetical protein